MATDAAKDTLPSRSDRDGLFDNPAETTTSWIPNPSPSHPYDRAKAHNKRVAIMRCQILSVEWHFPPNQAARLESHSKSCSACTVARQMGLRREACVSGGAANGAESGAAFSETRSATACASVRWRWVDYSTVPMRPCRFCTAPLAQSALSPHKTNQRAKSLSCAACRASVDIYFLQETLSYCKPVN